MRGPIQRNTVSLNRNGHLWPVLFSETVFLWIGPPFRRIGPFRKPNAPILTKHPVHVRIHVHFHAHVHVHIHIHIHVQVHVRVRVRMRVVCCGCFGGGGRGGRRQTEPCHN